MSEAAAQPHQDPLINAARELQQSHRVTGQPPRAVPVWSDLQSMSRWVDKVQTFCVAAEPECEKAAEWLMDNRYQVHRAIRQIRGDLPAKFYQRLPSLENPGQQGLPRAYCLAHGMLSATHLQLSLTTAVRFVRAYQEDTPLTIAELWAFPTMLRLACLEILVGATERIFQQARSPFEAVTFASALEVLDPEECLARSLASLGVIASIVWKDFFDRASVVESTLRRDPAAVYARMDFDTRDRYRNAIEDLAQGAGRSESEVAAEVLARARSMTRAGRRGHIGYWLVDDGRGSMEAALGYRASSSVAVGRWLLRHAGPCYAAALAILGLAALGVPALYAWNLGAAAPVLIAIVVLSLLPASILSVTLVHWIVTLTAPPRVLPKLDFEKGITPDCRTAVVVPVIIGGPKEVPGLIERLEMHWLRNPDPQLRFALLSDLADAPAQRIPTDPAVEQTLVDAVRRLNVRHGRDGDGPFHLLHRARQYNSSEGCWMGWERKRGKLEQFNRFVLSGDASAFPLQEGDSRSLQGVRFVITVDADTMLPAGSARRLVGTLAHPLNEPEFDPTTGRLCAGFTVVQPRVEISPESDSRSLFSRLYAGDTAIDIYSHAVSDVYQDLFGSGVYVGKGIYEVEAFDRCLAGRVPENALLSHDLFEGAHGHVALASDIVLYDDFPRGYLEYAHRWHRWVRGDWQLLPWLAARVPAADDRYLPNLLPRLERWKILDNLRRSLIPSALIALVVAGWMALPGNPWIWTLLTVAAPGAYLFTDLVTGLAHGRRRGAVRGTARLLRNQAGRWLLALVFLLNDAAVSLDAIGRTLWRLFVSRGRLLTWTSAAHTAGRLAQGSPRSDAWREMWMGSVISGLFAILLALVNPTALGAAGPLLLIWFVAPEIAARTRRPRVRAAEELGAKERAFLRGVARRTWLYFETFAGPEDNWLVPDNFQEDPHPEVAHRTSPTNIGMLFLSSLTAWDFGYLGPQDLALRVQNGLDTLDRLERYRGHFLNWYDTRTLAPLEPRYVSTVDSGNLAVSLVTLKQGCMEAASAPALRTAQWDGLADTLELLASALEDISNELSGELSRRMQAMRERIAALRDRTNDWHPSLVDLASTTWPDLEATIIRAISSPEAASFATVREIHVWLERVNHHLAVMQSSFETLFPWLALTEAPPAGCEQLAQRIADLLAPTLSLGQANDRCKQAAGLLTDRGSTPARDDATGRWLSDLGESIDRGGEAQRELRRRLLDDAARAEAMAFAMDFALLYDRDTRLFHIGYNVSSDRMDSHHYDLLATEARLASYFAIAKRDVPAEHWYFLGRPVARSAGELSLLSWNGSMFEYLMPRLLLRSGADRLLDQSERAAVDVQQRYAKELDVPWGASESAFAFRDADRHYQYRSFGVPGLGLRRGLAEDVVIAPYATALALAVSPVAALKNLERMMELELLQLYGFLEAADFTPERTVAGRHFTPIRMYMAHHQGMVLAAIGNALNDNALVRRFSGDMRMRAVDLLLQERIPWEAPGEPTPKEEPPEPKIHPEAGAAPQPWEPQSAAAFPQVHMLGNGRLATWISEAGGGALWWQRQALTRWRPDATCDDHGLWTYVRDEDSDALWSMGRQPTGVESEDARVVFHPHMAEFHRRDSGISIRMEVGIAPADDLEIRRITIVNETDRARRLQVTSYGEVVLAPPLDDERHPAFSKLFVGCEHMPALDGLLFTRRPRDPRDQTPVLLHCVVCEDPESTVVSFEADRSAFLGRNGNLRRPRGVVEGLSGTSGWTLDPIMALQLPLELEPRERRQFAFLTMAGGSREAVLELAERYVTLASIDWALNDAAREAAREAQRLELQSEQLSQLQSLASLILAPQPALRATRSEIAANRLGQPHLWALGLSGDFPIVVLRMDNPRDADLLRTLIRAHQLWQRRSFRVDLVILRTGVSGYEEPVRERVLTLVRETAGHEALGGRGGIHLVFADQITLQVRSLLRCTSRVVLDASGGALARQLTGAFDRHPLPPPFEPRAMPVLPKPTEPLAHAVRLRFDNGIGGFSENGEEYVIRLQSGDHTPAPWCNILANDEFGCLVTESGGGFTWAVNSGENRLTHWTNDPVADPPSEVLYLRDEETAEVWTPTPAPAGGDTACEIRHGAGYTKWRTRSHGFEQELTLFVASDDPVKFARLELRNLLPQGRRVTATYYAEWLLGALQSVTHPHIVGEYDASSHALLARSSWNPEFAERVAFLTCVDPPHSITTNRTDFLGREGDPSRPAGLLRWDLGGNIGGGDPCAAFQVHLEVAAGETKEVVFILGQGRDRAHAHELIRRWRDPERIGRAFEAVRAHWDRQLGALRVKTPDPGFDLMLNRWLLYQTLASRVLARAGFYQAGGAIGFRDQLQDILALLHTDPGRARAHILECAAHQFEEGDVLHWWHPPQGRGVRTRCSDDLLWLPYVASRYVEATGDLSILTEEAAFLRAPTLSADEEDRYGLFETSSERRTLFEHCSRALERGITHGPHGLPLIGSGDWNDGMNRAGRRGRGESIWLGWFAIATMTGFADMAARVGREDLVERWMRRAEELRSRIEAVGWDGSWYIRALDDEGKPWGSRACDECRIDSIAQSWAVLSSEDPSDRARIAVESAARELVRDDDRLALLLWPPFHESPRDPGYIKAYPPGIRENGGQYAHAAAWLGFAFAGLGDGDRAWRMFDLINPIGRTASRADVERYRDEPYVLAADVASVAPHVGRGGWSWYTGAASWTWRLGVEGILGLRRRGGELLIDPCLPKDWGSVHVQIEGPTGTLAITIEDPDHVGRGLVEMSVDGVPFEGETVAFPTDGTVREVYVRLRHEAQEARGAV